MRNCSEHPAVRLLSELLDIPSPPGREERMAAFLRGKVEALGFEVDLDPAGNLMVHLPVRQGGGDRGRVVFAAHMDEIALVVSKIEANGNLRVVRSGGMLPGKLGERMVEILGDDGSIWGVVSSGAGHGRQNANGAPTWNDYWITTGLSPEQLRKKKIYPGAAMVPAREGRGPFVFGDEADPLVAAWTFDDRMGVVTLLRLLEGCAKTGVEFSRPVTVAFTVHEEGGAHGGKRVSHLLRPEILIAVDGCPLAPEADLKIGGGPVVWAKDLKTNYDVGLLREFQKAADACGLNLQRAVLENAYSDASASYDVGGVPRVAVVGHLRENSHGFEVAKLSAFDEVLLLLENYVRTELV